MRLWKKGKTNEKQNVSEFYRKKRNKKIKIIVNFCIRNLKIIVKEVRGKSFVVKQHEKRRVGVQSASSEK